MSDAPQNPYSLAGQTALITGGGTGLGLGIATAFAAMGARVVISGRREEVLQSAVATLGDAADYRVHDVTDSASSTPLVDSIEAAHGRITCLVNNAGNLVKKPAEELTDDDMLAVLNTHVLGAFSLTRVVANRMLDGDGGSIGWTAAFLASPAAKFITGTCLPVDGGASIGF